MGSTLRFHIKGCSPYGFRLLGGHGKPVVITKLRPRSKAAEAGVQEGDVVLSINGHSADDVSFERLMSLVEHAGHYLDLEISRAHDGIHYNDVSKVTSAKRPAPTEPRDWLESIYSSGNTEEFTNNAETRKWSTNAQPPPPPPPPDRWSSCSPITPRKRPVQSPLIIAPTRRSPTWQDGDFQRRDFHRQQSGVRTPDAFAVTWNPDRSVTMSLSLFDDECKENVRQVSPPPQRHRNEAYLVINGPPPASLTPSPPPPPVPPRPVQSALSPAASTDGADSWTQDSVDGLANFAALPKSILKIISPSNEIDVVESLKASPDHKKKVFADSSFFDDPSHHYPTIDEQMKMARKVAQSLTSSANRSARGQRMFMKRREKSDQWATDHDADDARNVFSDSEHDLYYNPAPWVANADRPWAPTTTTDRKRRQSDTGIAAPTPPPLSALQLYAPKIPTSLSDEQAKALSADELERMRLFDPKSTHDSLAPQVCFSLAADLHQMKDKGGRMFAKRREAADRWTVEAVGTPPDRQRMMDKISVDHAVRFQTSSTPAAASAAAATPIGRLQAMLREAEEVPRAKMTPWEAAAEYGNVDPAFEHLRELAAGGGRKTPTAADGRPDAFSPIDRRIASPSYSNGVGSYRFTANGELDTTAAVRNNTVGQVGAPYQAFRHPVTSSSPLNFRDAYRQIRINAAS